MGRNGVAEPKVGKAIPQKCNTVQRKEKGDMHSFWFNVRLGHPPGVSLMFLPR